MGVLAACEHVEEKYGPKSISIPEPVGAAESADDLSLKARRLGPASASPTRSGGGLARPELYYGDVRRARQPVQVETGVNGAPGGVTFNFVDTNVLEVVDVLLGQTLGRNYVFDTALQGTVTARTSAPIPMSSVMAVLENILALNGAALVESDGVLNVVPIASVSKLPSTVVTPSSGPLRPGISTYVMPLRFASVESVREIVAPQVSPDNRLAFDPVRNFIIYTGPSQEAEVIRDLVSVLDVDLLNAKSFGLFPVKSGRAEDVADEVRMLFSDPALAGTANSMELLPIDRLNAILAIANNPGDLDKIAIWIRRLDRSDARAGRNVYVYYARNSNAVDLVDVLAQVFGGAPDETPRPETRRSPVAPGLEPARIVSGTGAAAENEASDTQAPTAEARPTARERRTVDVDLDGRRESTPIRIVAHDRNNAVVITATEDEYARIETALRQLDVLPLQVLIEATIAEVELNDDLEYGVQWAFENGDISGGLINSGSILNTTFSSGFNLVLETTSVQVVLKALAEVTNVEVVSSPQLMVLDNHSARLQVGDQIPVEIGESVTDGGTIVTSTQYFDTGVILEVTPRVNEGGLVTLEITQEVSEVADRLTVGTNSPTISQRRISSIVSVQSGDTIALGGLIRERASDGESGIPLFMDIPILGNLFKTTERDARRTELLILLTPRVIRGSEQAREITNELRKRLNLLQKDGRRSG